MGPAAEAWLGDWAWFGEGAGLHGLSPPTTTQRQWAGPGGGAELSDSTWLRPLSHSTFRPVQIRKQGAGLKAGVRGQWGGAKRHGHAHTTPPAPPHPPMGPQNRPIAAHNPTALPHSGLEAPPHASSPPNPPNPHYPQHPLMPPQTPHSIRPTPPHSPQYRPIPPLTPITPQPHQPPNTHPNAPQNAPHPIPPPPSTPPIPPPNPPIPHQMPPQPPQYPQYPPIPHPPPIPPQFPP